MLTPRKEELADGVTLYLGDNLSILPAVHGERAILTDPPYGQHQNTNVGFGEAMGAGVASGKRRVARGLHRTGVGVQWPDGIIGDDGPFDPHPWLEFSPRALFWGAHRFAERLPAGSWLVWDKVPTGKVRKQGDGEAAWMSGPSRPMRIYRLLWDGVCVGSAARDEVTAGQQRVHPTQKPVVLMKWCIGQMQLPSKTIIIDPYMGSGSTGVAAVHLGYPFVGAEIVPQYFDTARRRISEALKQGDMFIDRAQAATGSK